MNRRKANEEPGISSAIVAPVLRALAEAGFDAGRYARLRNESAGAVVEGSTADALFDAAAAQLTDDAVGLTVARNLPIGALGPLDYALCTSAALGEALRRVASHYAVVTDRVKLFVVDEPPRASLLLHRRAGIDHSHHWIEFSFAVIAARMRETLGTPIAFDAVAFAHAAPVPAAVRRHEEFFGARVSFSQPRDRLSFPTALLDQPLRTASKYLASLLDEQLHEIEKAVSDADPMLDRVKRAVLELLDERQTELALVAARLHMSRRTLQRELAARGTAHKDVLDGIRRERALHLLGDRGCSTVEVADRLAFSDQRAFFRAFRRWTGTSPKAFRDAARAR